MEEHRLNQLSRTMAYALRHAPEQFSLTLDAEGWVSVQDLAAALQRRRAWRDVQEGDFAAVISQSEKKRYEIRDGLIRAYYGHSTPQKVTKEPAIPPEILWHGTTRSAANTICREGLKPMGRQYTHLSSDKETARQVALRRTSQPAILQIAALQAHQQGIKFYLGNDSVWLAEHVPPQFIQ
ncbi:RNA 2'-phosphotransferase [Ktedonosporobacter rubrisoli]|uniref:Probable RNA 2'-phosphotransferase n=1 Tax=Ktedonosporobacter rubrisoli TaxID=2509675 RepID=A0A4P6JLD3_KTERU|nr:RNA 2'-phosphotransferase [Ktedonosporobacter rubrisoli]QBD76019.1 RNA 2'-phosphotransferase [Ktedonosporobacter rubrisoli]